MLAITERSKALEHAMCILQRGIETSLQKVLAGLAENLNAPAGWLAGWLALAEACACADTCTFEILHFEPSLRCPKFSD